MVGPISRNSLVVEQPDFSSNKKNLALSQSIAGGRQLSGCSCSIR